MLIKLAYKLVTNCPHQTHFLIRKSMKTPPD